MSDVYFIQVQGADVDVMESIANQADDMEMEDNIVIVPDKVEPLTEEMAISYLEEMAEALDMSIDGEKQ